MLPDSPDVELVYAGEQGVFSGVKPGSLLIDMSSISPIVARKLAAKAEKRGCDMLDAPVSGAEVGAIGATLSIMIGGKVSAVERAMPIFQTLGKNIVRVGDAGTGQVTKAASQMILGTTIAIMMVGRRVSCWTRTASFFVTRCLTTSTTRNGFSYNSIF